ncbi:MAG: type VI secretion system ImpA family N-terminal domain-containing protein [Ignavibacteriota bacterium]
MMKDRYAPSRRSAEPIPGESPAGANLRYDPVTDKIKEARREDLDLDQGVWKTALKTADWPAVIKMAGEAIAKRGKDLQIAVWLVDAQIRKDGFSALAPCFQFLHDLLEQYWDVLYPPIDEDGDMEVRSAPLVWLGSKLNEPLVSCRSFPIS